MIKYYKLFDLLTRRGMKKTDLLEIMSSHTLAKISKGENINTDVIDKICHFLMCQPEDIMEVVYEEKKIGKIDTLKTAFQAGMKFIDNKSEDEFKKNKLKGSLQKGIQTSEELERLRKTGTKKDLKNYIDNFE